MRDRIFALVAAALFILSAAAHARAQQGHAIRGKLRSATGEVVPRIIVDLHTGNGFPVGKTTSTQDGDFEFNGLSGSSFLVVVTHPDYEPYQERVEFLSDAGENRPGETRTVEMTLTPKPTAAFAPGRVTFAQSVPPAALAAFERGAKLSREGKPREAAAELREAVRLFPDYFDAHFTLGAELLRAGDHEGAISEFEHARRVNPREDAVYGAFGAVMMLQRKFAVAAAAYAEAARLDPREARHQLFRGTALVEHAITLAPAAPERKRGLRVVEHALALGGRAAQSLRPQQPPARGRPPAARAHPRAARRAGARRRRAGEVPPRQPRRQKRRSPPAGHQDLARPEALNGVKAAKAGRRTRD